MKFSGHPVVVREIRIVPNNTCVAIEPNIYSQGSENLESFRKKIYENVIFVAVLRRRPPFLWKYLLTISVVQRHARSKNFAGYKLILSVRNKLNIFSFFSFDYRADKEIRLVPTLPIATDGLLIRGFYQVITLAIYGEPAPEEQTPPPPPSFASAPARTPSGIPSTVSPTQPNHRQMRMPLLAPVSQPTPTSTGWPAPILGLPEGNFLSKNLLIGIFFSVHIFQASLRLTL